MANYIFDFDGTIADSISLGIEVIIKNARYLKCKQIQKNDIPLLKEMHTRDILNYLHIPFWHVPFFVYRFKKLCKKRVAEVIIFPQLPDILNQCKEKGHTLGIISTNSKLVIESILKTHGLFDCFNFIYGDISLHGKYQCLKKHISENQYDPNETYYIGDEVRDIEAAHASKIHSIAVSWGANSSEKLLSASPGHFVEDLNQLNKLLTIDKHNVNYEI